MAHGLAGIGRGGPAEVFFLAFGGLAFARGFLRGFKCQPPKSEGKKPRGPAGTAKDINNARRQKVRKGNRL